MARTEEMVYIEFAAFTFDGGMPGLGQFKPLWTGQYTKVLQSEDVCLAEFAAGGGGAVKYCYEDRVEFHGKTCLIHKHIHGRHPKVAVLIHDHQPLVLVEREVVWREDHEFVALVYRYATTGTTIAMKIYFGHVAFMHLRLFDSTWHFMLRHVGLPS